MLKVTYGTDKIEIWFYHKIFHSREIEKITSIIVDEDRKCSMVVVMVNSVYVSRGMAICHPVDNFCRAIGRKRALTYALHSFDKATRTAVWDEYKIQMGF